MTGNFHVKRLARAQNAFPSSAALTAAVDGPLPRGPDAPGGAAPFPAASPLALSGVYLARTLQGEREIHAILKTGALHALSIDEARHWLGQLQPLIDLVDGKIFPAKKRG